LLRDGELTALTADHSVVAEMHREGLLSAEEAEAHPRRNELTRSVGVAPSVEVEVAEFAVEPGDRFLLCSDGLCGYVRDDEIREVLQRERPSSAARILVDRANAKGGYDNVTVQVAAIPDTAPLGGDAAGETEASPPSSEPPAMRHLREPRPERAIHPFTVAATAVLALLLAAVALWLLLRG
jgi:serine/threonine protein phosphatase PrpC